MGESARVGAAACRTLAIIKPDAVAAGKAEEILHLAELAGFTVIQQQRTQLTPAQAEAFYAEHRERPFFPGLVEFMTSGSIVVAVLAQQGAVQAWRALIGPSNALEARVKAPKCLRALYGSDGTRNAVHGSDSATSAAREIRFFFPALPAQRGEVLAGEAAKAFITEKLQPTLVKALTALAKAKPSSNKTEALTFLANWMLDNNPNKPKLVLPEGAAAAAAEAAARAQQQKQQQQSLNGSNLAASGPSTDGGVPPEAPTTIQAEGGAGGIMSALHSSEEQAAAATKVQAAFRGHQARLQVAEARSAVGQG